MGFYSDVPVDNLDQDTETKTSHKSGEFNQSHVHFFGVDARAEDGVTDNSHQS